MHSTLQIPCASIGPISPRVLRDHLQTLMIRGPAWQEREVWPCMGVQKEGSRGWLSNYVASVWKVS